MGNGQYECFNTASREYHESFEIKYFPDLVFDYNATIHKDTVYSQFSSHLPLFRPHARMVIHAFFGLLLNVKTLNQVCQEITEEPALSPEKSLSLCFADFEPISNSH